MRSVIVTIYPPLYKKKNVTILDRGAAALQYTQLAIFSTPHTVTKRKSESRIRFVWLTQRVLGPALRFAVALMLQFSLANTLSQQFNLVAA